MDHAITVKEVIVVLAVLGGFALFIGGLAWVASILADAFKH